MTGLLWSCRNLLPREVYVLAKETAFPSILNTNFFGIVYFVDKTENRFFLQNFCAIIRAFFEIQVKRPVCLKRESNLGNTSWPDSAKLVRISGTIDSWFEQVIYLDPFLWHVEIFTVSCFVSGFLRKAGNDRRINWNDFFFHNGIIHLVHTQHFLKN